MKMSQIDTENDKNSKTFIISKIYALSSKFPTDFVDWNVEKGQQGKNVLSNRLFRRICCTFLSENVSNWHRKWQKSRNFLIVHGFMHFSPLFDSLRQLERWKWSTRKACVVVLSSILKKEINADLQTKTVRNWHRKRQNFETFQICTIFVRFVRKIMIKFVH